MWHTRGPGKPAGWFALTWVADPMWLCTVLVECTSRTFDSMDSGWRATDVIVTMAHDAEDIDSGVLLHLSLRENEKKK